MLDFEARRCIQPEDVYGAVVCPEGFFQVTEDVFSSKCTDLGSECSTPPVLSHGGRHSSLHYHLGSKGFTTPEIARFCTYDLSVLCYIHSPVRCHVLSFSREQGEPCPDGYTCVCYPCEQLPEFEFSLSLQASGEPVGEGLCQEMATCASGILAFSNLTLLVTDNWGPAREVQCITRKRVGRGWEQP